MTNAMYTVFHHCWKDIFPLMGFDHSQEPKGYLDPAEAIVEYGAFIERIGAGLVSLGMSSAAAWNLAARSMKPVMKRLENNGYIRNIPFGLKGWFACRDLPGMPEKTFHEWWKAKGRKG